MSIKALYAINGSVACCLKLRAINMTKINKLLFIGGLVIALTGCQSSRELSNSFESSYTNKRAKLTFHTSNFSANHLPPLIKAFAYLDSYLYSDFCGDSKKAIGKASVNKDNTTQETWLPNGKIVANIGYYAVGGGGLTGDSYYVLEVEPDLHYRVTLTESRPFVTSYSVTIETDTRSPKILAQYSSAKALCAGYSG
ncbi:hypothetical protein J7384_16610 [Endozoicomonas sp. G2_1]|uniref:hypothetical protein n=1 Tax=Endozoicomonas sp. G2_1 TaxID=2821091 RepID=UPI001AD9AE32|nr:hypothetical protein [Endozoicomonas sp. G2_1]MBO9491984.1 hypothetical protein [Endozoicomonas sp. G2_1]